MNEKNGRKITLDLRQNALDSMEESLKKFNDGLGGNEKSLKFAILNISHFIELSFKYFVSKINHVLIYKNACAEKLNDKITISMWEAINFYKNANPHNLDLIHDKELNFSENIRWLKEIRNDIEHNKCEIYVKPTRNNLGKILNFMNELYIREEELSLDKGLSVDLASLLIKLIDDFKKKLIFAESDARSEVEQYYQSIDKNEPNSNNFGEILRICSDCGNMTLTYREKEDKYYCHFCEEFDDADTCWWCNEKFPHSQTVEGLSGEGYDNYCSSGCFENDMERK